MRKIIRAINMTLDGVFDHTAGIPDEEIHEHYAELLRGAGIILYGRITYQLMQYWQELAHNPSGEKSMDDFALAIDNVPKIVFSHTLKSMDWESATLSQHPLEEEVLKLKQQPGNDIFVGSRSLIIQLLKSNLLDELQLCVYPVIAGSGMLLFENMDERKVIKMTKTRAFRGGAVILYYEPENR